MSQSPNFVWFLVLYGLVLGLLYLLFKLAHFACHQWRLYQKLKHFPGPEIHLPLVGNLRLVWNVLGPPPYDQFVGERIHAILNEQADQYGAKHGVYRLWIGPYVPWILVCDAQLAKKVLTSPVMQSKGMMYRLVETFLTFGPTAFSGSAEHAKLEHRRLKPFFSLQYLEVYLNKTLDRHLPALRDHLARCVDEQEGHYEDLNALSSRYIMDTAGDNLFNTRFGTLLPGARQPETVYQIHKLVHWFQITVLQPWRYLPSRPVLCILLNLLNHKVFSRLTLQAARDLYAFHRFVNRKVVLPRIRALNKEQQKKKGEKIIDSTNDQNDREPFLDVLARKVVQAKGLYGKLTAYMQTMSQTSFFFIAGHDTTTTVLTWTMFHLAKDQVAQSKARDEVHAYLSDLANRGEKPNFKNLKQLPFLEACLKEALRLHPVGPYLPRYSSAPFVVDDQVTIPSDVNVIVLARYCQHQAKYYPEPERFLPERFLETNAGELSASTLTLPFSGGSRTCVAQQYAMQQMKLFFVTLLDEYVIELPTPDYEIVETHNFLTKSPSFPGRIRRHC